MAGIDFLPVCNNCGTVLWGQTINIATEEFVARQSDKDVAFTHRNGIIPFECPTCRAIFEHIAVPTKLPFTTPEKPRSFIFKKEVGI